MTSPPRRSGRWLTWVISAAVTAALLTYLLQGIDARRIFDTAAGAAPGPFFVFLGLFTAGIAARACRFWILLGRVVPLRLVLAITVVRNLFVDLLPARLGELSYVYLLTTRARRPVEEGIATLTMAFLLDLAALSPLLLAALLVVGGAGRVSVPIAIGLSVALAALSGAVMFTAGPMARWLGARLDRPPASGRRQVLAVRLRALAASLDRARGEGVLLPAFALSIVVRLCKYGSSFFLILSLLTPLGYTIEQLGVFRIFLGSVAAEVAASLPIHGLAGFGTYEAAWTLALEELGYPREHAVISGLLGHAITQIIEYVMGGLAFLWLMRPATGARLEPAGHEADRA